MNDTLSSLIAFVGFLIVFSLLIQSIQEALKNLFKLKTGVWERFFLNLYETDFKIKRILPETSFWERVRSGPFVGEFDQRFKRLKTIIMKTDGYFKELKQTLMDILEMDLSDPTHKKAAQMKIERLSEQVSRITGLNLGSILEIYDKNKKGVITELIEKFEKISIVFDDFEDGNLIEIQGACEKLYAVTRKLETKIFAYRSQIESKADAWLVQLQGEYKKNMLKWTLMISIFSVVLLNADSFTIYEYFTINSKAQELMIENVAAAVSERNKQRAEDLNDMNKAIKAGDFEMARTDILGFVRQLENEFQTLNDTVNIKKAATLLEETQAIDPKDKENSQLLNGLHRKLISLYVTLQKRSVNFQMEGLTSTGLPLGWRGDWNAIWQAESFDLWIILVVKKICGLILTIFLISFGAPFWQNIMNAIVGLKTIYQKPGSDPT